MPFSEKISTAASSNSRRRSSAGRLRLLRLLGPVALLAGLFACRCWRFSTGHVWHGKRAVGTFVLPLYTPAPDRRSWARRHPGEVGADLALRLAAAPSLCNCTPHRVDFARECFREQPH